MKEITIREAVTENDAATFWQQLHTYLRRDIFPDRDPEGERYLNNNAYQTQVETIHNSARDRSRYLFFYRDGVQIGFALPVIYDSEDGKCFVLDFCVYPEFRGNGAGTACAEALIAWAKEHRAPYLELSYGEDAQRLRFWQRVGFQPNGVNEWGDSLLLYPPTEGGSITVESLTDPEDWQLRKLENGFLKEIGEGPLTEEKQVQLAQAIRNGSITFFLAKRGFRAVGMCSVVRCWSTFSCGWTGVFDDFFVEPVFRGQGIARQLSRTAQDWCRKQGMASLSVSCAPCDEGMYQSLGFDVRLGSTYTKILE